MKGIIFLLLGCVFYSCNYFKKPKEPQSVARVGEVYLYEKDIEQLVPSGTTKQDSVAIIKSFLNRWATQKLLFSGAEVNLSDEKVSELNELIEQYKIDLYTKAYIEELVVRKIDTVISNQEIVDYYEVFKENFRNSSELVKLRYINLVKENPKFDNIKSKFISFAKKDILDLEETAIQFKSYAFNDSIWVDVNQVFKKLPFINQENKEEFLSNGKNFDFSDSTSVWMVKIREVLPKNSITPLQFLKPTIRQIILNNRKIELINKIEKDLIDDAIKSKKYEIYK